VARPLITLEHVDVVVEGKTILRDLYWRLRPGEHWAIVGGNGSGKSTLLKLIRGEFRPAPGGGRLVYAFDDDVQTTAVGVREKIALVSPELQSRYLQQEWKLTGWQVVHSGFAGGDYVYQRPTAAQRQRAHAIICLLGIRRFLGRNVQELSTGELRKVLIARALAGAPRILACDEICDGLDAASRAGLLQTLDQVARHGTQLLHVTHRAEELIPSITHRLELKAGRVARQTPTRVGQASSLPQGLPARDPITGRMPAQAGWKPAPLAGPGPSRGERASAKPNQRRFKSSQPRALLSIRGASVYLGSKPVLRNIHLDICPGEHWAILGPNGAGKSTLLQLMLGDLHPAWGGVVWRFGFPPGNTIWEARRTIGFISPGLQSNYREPLTGAEVIASGFFSSIGLTRRVSRAQRQRVAALIGELDLPALAGRSVLQMSYGEFRLILLARALVQRPELILCDEPFDGLDATARERLSRALTDVACRGTSLVMVTHHQNDLPACITHVAELNSGRITFQGTLAALAGRSLRLRRR
jgi:molybdate transport system ATP-binding protein